MATYEQIGATLSEYLVDRVTAEDNSPFGYTGILPPLSSKDDFRNYPIGYYPLLGVALGAVDYWDGSIGLYNPLLTASVLFSNRTSGISPDEDVPLMLRYSQQIQNILLQAERETRFGIPDTILTVQMVNCIWYPTFYTEVDQDRKAFQVASIALRLSLGGI